MTIMFKDNHIKKVSDLLPVIASLQNACMGSTHSRIQRANWIYKRLIRFKYKRLSKHDKGILCKYLCIVAGCTRRTINRHIKAYKKGKLLCRSYQRNQFTTIYTNHDKKLLVETDNLHGRLNGNATRKILKDEYKSNKANKKIGNEDCKRLSKISCSHIYNLRKSRIYREHIQIQGKTKSVQNSIGERIKPQPNGSPGYLRVDTVHQGDSSDGTKGLYHINLVDEVTQWQIVVSVEAISEQFLNPVLEQAIKSFPFLIRNFHSDNGSEYINKTVATLLNKLFIKQTKSRSRKTNDNALCEGKNASTIRKHIGHWHIPKQFVARLNKFYKDFFVPYLNYYRPCAFPVRKELENGKIKITYPANKYMTPAQKLLSIKNIENYLSAGITIKTLQQEVSRKTPNQAAKAMQKAKHKFLKIALQQDKSKNT